MARLGGWCLGLVAASVVLLVGVGIVYLPLQVDGGWYSYPAFAYSLGRGPFSHQLDLPSACTLQGVRVLFGFETSSSIRLAASREIAGPERLAWVAQAYTVLTPRL